MHPRPGAVLLGDALPENRLLDRRFGVDYAEPVLVRDEVPGAVLGP